MNPKTFTKPTVNMCQNKIITVSVAMKIKVGDLFRESDLLNSICNFISDTEGCILFDYGEGEDYKCCDIAESILECDGDLSKIQELLSEYYDTVHRQSIPLREFYVGIPIKVLSEFNVSGGPNVDQNPIGCLNYTVPELFSDVRDVELILMTYYHEC
jgi:hypothetical protein